MYIMSAVSQGERFSDAVRRAVEKVPSPTARGSVGHGRRAQGSDLARLLGYRGPAPVPHSLVPRPLGLDRSVLRGLPKFDKEWADRAAREKKGCVLRYVVTAPRSVTAKLQAVPASSPMGRSRARAT